MKKKLLTLLFEGDGEMMKKMLVLMLVFGLASVASAQLLISVNGDVDPEDTSITLLPSEYAVIDIWGDGRAQPQAAFLIVEYAGSIAGHTMLYLGDMSEYQELEEFAAGMGATPAEVLAMVAGAGYTGATDLSFMGFGDTPGGDYPTLDGVLVDEIMFHCEGLGDVILTLTDGELVEVFDTQIIHQIPEPATMALLGLGGLFLRRRKKSK